MLLALSRGAAIALRAATDFHSPPRHSLPSPALPRAATRGAVSHPSPRGVVGGLARSLA